MAAIPNQVLADCASDCRKVINAADKTIQDQKTEIDLLHQEVSSSEDLASTYLVQLHEDQDKLDSPFRNPWITLPLGILAGVLAVSIIKK